MTAQSSKPCLSAVFVDYDNIYLSLKRKNEEAAKRFAKDAGSWIQEISSGRLITPTNGSFGCVNRRVVMNRCYGNPVPRRNSQDNSTDMNSFPFVRHHFLRSGFEIIDCPPLTAQLKNSSDIRMVMDVRDFLTHDTYFDEFVILSGDADFTPLLHRLRAHARRTIIFANDYTAAPYTSICDGEIRESDLITLLLDGRLPGENEDGNAILIETDSRRNEAIRKEIIAEIVEGVRAAAAPVPLEALADRALRILGHDKTAGSSWGGTGGFRELLTQCLPDNISLSEKPPYYAYDKNRHVAPQVLSPSATDTKPAEAPNAAAKEPTQLEPAQLAPTQTEPTRLEPTQLEPAQLAPAQLVNNGLPSSPAVLQPALQPNAAQATAALTATTVAATAAAAPIANAAPVNPAPEAALATANLSVETIATRPPQTAEQSYAAAANAHSQAQRQSPGQDQGQLRSPGQEQATALQSAAPQNASMGGAPIPATALAPAPTPTSLQPVSSPPAASTQVQAARSVATQAALAPSATAQSVAQPAAAGIEQQPAAPSAERQPDAASAMQQSITRIHDACQAPTLAPPEYRVLFEVMAEEINENGLTGVQTLSNIAHRAQSMGLEIQRDDVRFVLDVVSESDPWFEQGASANLFAGRFRNFVVARCRGQGLNLSAEELDLIEAWFAGSAPTVAAAPPTSPMPGTAHTPAPAQVQPADPQQNQSAGGYGDQFGGTANTGAADEEFPRIVRSRLRG